MTPPSHRLRYHQHPSTRLTHPPRPPRPSTFTVHPPGLAPYPPPPHSRQPPSSTPPPGNPGDPGDPGGGDTKSSDEPAPPPPEEQIAKIEEVCNAALGALVKLPVSMGETF